VVADVNPRIVGITNLYRKNFIFFNGHGLLKTSFTFARPRASVSIEAVLVTSPRHE